MQVIATTNGTGVLARLDGLGRIVLPKPMRKRLGLAEGDLLLAEGDNTCIKLRKYVAEGDLAPMIDTMRMQLEELSYAENLPQDAVAEMKDLVDKLDQTLKTATSKVLKDA